MKATLAIISVTTQDSGDRVANSVKSLCHSIRLYRCIDLYILLVTINLGAQMPKIYRIFLALIIS